MTRGVAAGACCRWVRAVLRSGVEAGVAGRSPERRQTFQENALIHTVHVDIMRISVVSKNSEYILFVLPVRLRSISGY